MKIKPSSVHVSWFSLQEGVNRVKGRQPTSSQEGAGWKVKTSEIKAQLMRSCWLSWWLVDLGLQERVCRKLVQEVVLHRHQWKVTKVDILILYMWCCSFASFHVCMALKCWYGNTRCDSALREPKEESASFKCIQVLQNNNKNTIYTFIKNKFIKLQVLMRVF